MKINLTQKQLIPFLMAGDPNMETTEYIANEMIAEGVCTLELGVAFSDPMADGPTIQKASARALASGANLAEVLKLTERLKRKHPHVRIVLFSYLNPLLRFGLENYVARALEAGVNATLVVDLPVEESAEFLALHRRLGLGTVFLVSPTTTQARLLKIAQASSEFVYYVSRLGVTGEQSSISPTLATEIAALKQHVSLPIAVGFGISTAHQAGMISSYADFVVIGSRFCHLIEQSLIVNHHSLAATGALVRSFVQDCHEQIRAQNCEHISRAASKGEILEKGEADGKGGGHK
jgi:tryptophan synthase alpha chain